MQVTTETIQGRTVTVIRRPFDAEKVRESLAMGVPVVAEHKQYGSVTLLPHDTEETSKTHFTLWVNDDQMTDDTLEDSVHVCPDESFIHTITRLDPLPRHPTPADAWLLHRYVSEGIFPWLSFKQNDYDFFGAFSYHDGNYFCTKEMNYQGGNYRCYAQPKTTHVTDSKCNRLDVAITGE